MVNTSIMYGMKTTINLQENTSVIYIYWELLVP